MFHVHNGLSQQNRRAQTAVGLVLAFVGTSACRENTIVNNYYYRQVEQDAGLDAGKATNGTDQVDTTEAPSLTLDAGFDTVTDAGPSSTEVPTSESDADAESPVLPLDDGAPLVNATTAELELDLFGTFNNKYWFVVSQEQVDQMNQRDWGGCPGCYGDIYGPDTPGDNSSKTYTDHLLVTNELGQTADFGKVQTKVKGESTFREWTRSTLPNIRVDMDDFVPGQSLDGFEHLRFNNALVGSIFREKFTFDYYRELGYPAPYSTYGWVSNSIWGKGVEVPYVVTEVYKRSFCSKRSEYFGGECPNMWEFVGDLGGRGGWQFEGSVFDREDNCQFDVCESTRAKEFEDAVISTPQGPGFKEALTDYMDWDAFHDFQCLSWIFVTGDDALHNHNNVVIVERPDGKFQWLPYSIDISFGQDWYRYVNLPGDNSIARGCQADPACWADTVAACDAMLQRYIDSDPVQRLDNLYEQLGNSGMLRSGDDKRYAEMRSYIEERLAAMPEELELNREAPYYGSGGCEYPYVQCGKGCELPYNCPECGEYYLNDGDYTGGEDKPIPRPPVVAPPPEVGMGVADIAIVPGPAPVPIPVPPPPVPTVKPPIIVGDGGVPTGDGGVEIPPLCFPFVGYEK